MLAYTEHKVIEVKASSVSQDVINILEGIIDLTPVDPGKFMWMVSMETLKETIEKPCSQELTKFVVDCEATGCKYVLIVGG